MVKTKKTLREDGEETRNKLIECAGRLIADQGYDRTTSKEICKMAGTNPAAVNYHFGSRDGLYRAVLENVFTHILPLSELKKVADASTSPREKLENLLKIYLKEAILSKSWQIRVAIRELVQPTPFYMEYTSKIIGTRLGTITKVLGEYLQLPPDDDRVARCFFTVMAPFFLLLLSGHQQTGSILYRLSGREEQNLEAQIRICEDFIFGGLDRIKEEIKK